MSMSHTIRTFSAGSSKDSADATASCAAPSVEAGCRTILLEAPEVFSDIETAKVVKAASGAAIGWHARGEEPDAAGADTASARQGSITCAAPKLRIDRPTCTVDVADGGDPKANADFAAAGDVFEFLSATGIVEEAMEGARNADSGAAITAASKLASATCTTDAALGLPSRTGCAGFVATTPAPEKPFCAADAAGTDGPKVPWVVAVAIDLDLDLSDAAVAIERVLVATAGLFSTLYFTVMLKFCKVTAPPDPSLLNILMCRLSYFIACFISSGGSSSSFSAGRSWSDLCCPLSSCSSLCSRSYSRNCRWAALARLRDKPHLIKQQLQRRSTPPRRHSCRGQANGPSSPRRHPAADVQPRCSEHVRLTMGAGPTARMQPASCPNVHRTCRNCIPSSPHPALHTPQSPSCHAGTGKGNRSETCADPAGLM